MSIDNGVLMEARRIHEFDGAFCILGVRADRIWILVLDSLRLDSSPSKAEARDLLARGP